MTSLRLVLLAPRRAFSELKLLGVLLGANLLVALVSSAPLIVPALMRFGHSLSGRGQPFPSSEALSDFGRQLAQGGGPFLAGPLVLGLLGSFGMQLVLTGGIVSRLCSTERFRLALFARDCALQLGRNLRLLGWALLGLLPVAGLAGLAAWLLWLAHVPTLLLHEDGQALLDDLLSGWSLVHLGGVLVLFALWRASFDLARVQLVAEDQRKTRLALWRALGWMMRSPGALLGYLGLSAMGLLAVLLFARLHAALQVTSTPRAALALLLAQAVVLVRLGFSVATTAYTVEVHRALPPWTPPLPAAPASEPPPSEPPSSGPQPSEDPPRGD